MKTYTITITDAQDKALCVVAASPQDWIQNVVNVRCNASIDEIFTAEVNRKVSSGESISGTKEDIVMSASIETALERNARLEAEWAAEIAAKQEGA